MKLVISSLVLLFIATLKEKQLSRYPVMTEKSDRNIRKHSVISGNRYYCGAGTEYDLPYRL